MVKTKISILKNEDPYDHLPWEQACISQEEYIQHNTIDLTSSDWLQQIKKFNPSICLIKPSGKTSIYRTLYQERVDIIVHELNIRIFPSYNELRIYENKRFFSYWADAISLPHPNTWVFYSKDEVLQHIQQFSFPIVGKINIGASGRGVKILRTKQDLIVYTRTAFSDGLSSQTGPRIEHGKLIQRLWQKLINPQELYNRLYTYKVIAADRQKGFLILQEYIQHDFEWRVVRIGDSFFAHKKVKSGERASGTLKKIYDNPPEKLLSFIKNLTDQFGFFSVAVDLFENETGNYLVNEIQCIFGQSDPYQMLINKKPGRYRYIKGKWHFEEGDFTSNKCYDLRLKYILSTLF